MLTRICRLLLERRLYRLGKRTGALVTAPRPDEPIDQGAYEGGEDFIRFHAAGNTNHNGGNNG